MEATLLNTDGTMEKMADLTLVSESDMVRVVCGGATYIIPVNKLIGSSQFFARALEVPMVEKKERRVTVKDIEGSIFAKVMEFITEGTFQFNVEEEAFEALEAADRLDMEELKEEVCNRIKDNLESENAKAVLSLAERFSAKLLFRDAFDFMQENNIKLEKEDVVDNPNLALAFIEEYRLMLADMKEELDMKEEELIEKEVELEEKDDLLKYFRHNVRFDDFNDSFDYDEEDWQVYDSLEEVEDGEDNGEEEDEEEEDVDGKEDEEKVRAIYSFSKESLPMPFFTTTIQTFISANKNRENLSNNLFRVR